MIRGLDGSCDFKRPTWGRVDDYRKTGCSFAIWRASYGDAVDLRCKIETDRMLAAGVVPGGYLFLRHPQPVKPQLDAALRGLGNRFQPGWLPLTIDVEFGKGRQAYKVSARQALDRVLEVGSLYLAKLGHYPLIYWSWHVYRDELGMIVEPRLLEYPVWIVWCKTGEPKVPPPHGPGGHWLQQAQIEVKGAPGCSAPVDLNVWNTLPLTPNSVRAAWVARRIGAADKVTIKAWQAKRKLVPDAIIGPRTFSWMAWLPPKEA